MPSARKPSLILPVAVTLAVLLGLYVGAYYATVKPTLRAGLTPVSPVGDLLPIAGYAPPFAKVGRTVFAPIHWLDRRIRPHVWEPAE